MRSWEDWERKLRKQEEIERGLQRSFLSTQRARYSQRQMANVLRKATNICAELDERAGIADNDLLDREELPEDTAKAEQLVWLLSYLRDTHRYCMFCGSFFANDEDLKLGCPGLLEDDHDVDGGLEEDREIR